MQNIHENGRKTSGSVTPSNGEAAHRDRIKSNAELKHIGPAIEWLNAAEGSDKSTEAYAVFDDTKLRYTVPLVMDDTSNAKLNVSEKRLKAILKDDAILAPVIDRDPSDRDPGSTEPAGATVSYTITAGEIDPKKLQQKLAELPKSSRPHKGQQVASIA